MTIIVTMNYQDNQCDNYHYHHDHHCDIDLLQLSVWRRLLALVTDLILSIFHSIFHLKTLRYFPTNI